MSQFEVIKKWRESGYITEMPDWEVVERFYDKYYREMYRKIYEIYYKKRKRLLGNCENDVMELLFLDYERLYYENDECLRYLFTKIMF